MKSRPRGNRERRLRQFAGVEKRPASLLNARAYWRLHESSERPTGGDSSSNPPLVFADRDVRFWHLADIVIEPEKCPLMTQSGHLRSRPSPGIHWAALPTSAISKSRKSKAPVH
jgi:hypothetical protein